MRDVDDERFPFSYRPNYCASLQMEFPNRGSLHVAQFVTPGMAKRNYCQRNKF